MSVRQTFAFSFAILSFAAQAEASPLILVGVLESQPDPVAAEGAAARDHLRDAFQLRDGSWAAACEGKASTSRNEGCSVPQPEATKQWHVVFNGRTLGDVETAGWRNSDYYSFTGAMNLKTSLLPSVEEAATSFAAWWGQPQRRPLVAISGEAHVGTARTWQRERVKQSDTALAWPLFKIRVPVIPNCRFSDEGEPLGVTRAVELSDMIIFDRVKLEHGGALLGVTTDGSQDCAEDGGFASDFWIYIPAKGPSFVLEGFDTSGWAYSLKLVDVGSFSGDGSQQVIFSYSGYNEDGYVLYHDAFRKRVEFTWGYH